MKQHIPDNILEHIFGALDAPVIEQSEDGIDEDSIIRDIERSIDMEGAVGVRPGNTISYTEKAALIEALEEYERRQDYQGLLKFFPDEGMYAHDKYPKHMEFLRCGATHRERIFMAANRVGKTITGGYELAAHATGMYPKWWDGKRFPMPIDAWAAGDTGQTTRDIVQTALLGEIRNIGTGLIPKDCILEIRMRPGIPDAVDTVKVKHSSGGESRIGFKSYDQKRRAFQGTTKHVIWLDEEPPIEVYGECVIRTMTSGGVVYVTFTPLTGITPFVQEFLDAARSQGKLTYDQ